MYKTRTNTFFYASHMHILTYVHKCTCAPPCALIPFMGRSSSEPRCDPAPRSADDSHELGPGLTATACLPPTPHFQNVTPASSSVCGAGFPPPAPAASQAQGCTGRQLHPPLDCRHKVGLGTLLTNMRVSLIGCLLAIFMLSIGNKHQLEK